MTNRNERDDRTLLDELSRGNASAFWSLWEHHRARISDVCGRQMSGVPADADDAVSRAMMVAHEKLPEYASSIVNLEAWLTRLSCNICFDIHRERCRATRTTVSVDSDDADRGETLAAADSPLRNALTSELGKQIARAIDDLPPALRDAARLRFVDEESYPDMARKLSITEDNARKRVQQSRAMLRNRLKRELNLP